MFFFLKERKTQANICSSLRHVAWWPLESVSVEMAVAAQVDHPGDREELAIPWSNEQAGAWESVSLGLGWQG